MGRLQQFQTQFSSMRAVHGGCDAVRRAMSQRGETLFTITPTTACSATSRRQQRFLTPLFPPQAKLAEIKEQISRKAHADLVETGNWLRSVFRGRCQYYAVPGNYTRLQQFRDALMDIWLRTLRRRSQRGRRLT